ncbi:hypothetical protein SAY87_009619 [Trapa incisa]|uniref:DUF868 domain-containing protein n=1 Tax=Trapa incisa TaxID=236973 RepID=A0AAN7JZ24_9MYRT|nr:hypothetical protein SAY87_009619 [Trapa incisa]
MSTQSSPLPACFRPTTATDDDDPRPTAAPLPPPPPSSDSTNLTTCLYHTHMGIFSLTWSGSLLGRSLHLRHHHHGSTASPPPPSLPSSPISSSSSSDLSFHLHIKPFMFWKKHGSKKLAPNTKIFWDLSRAKFRSGRPEPVSGFYIAVVEDGMMALQVGDLVKEAYSKTKSNKPMKPQIAFLRRDHLYGSRAYSTTARIGGQTREISIECSLNGDGRLWFSVDRNRILQVKRLKWKFRGNERVVVDGIPINISWDVYNWMFEDSATSSSSAKARDGGHAVFMFRFEDIGIAAAAEGSSNFEGLENYSSFGMNEVELRKMRKCMLRTARSSSFSSISSSASMGSGSSSVMEWASSEDNELCGPIGFSLLVYAWKR